MTTSTPRGKAQRARGGVATTKTVLLPLLMAMVLPRGVGAGSGGFVGGSGKPCAAAAKAAASAAGGGGGKWGAAAVAAAAAGVEWGEAFAATPSP